MNNKGFTLIEMLVVVAIVGLLSSVVVVGLGGARSKARDAKRVSEVQQLLNWAEINYTATGYNASSTPPIVTDPQGVTYSYGTVAGNDQQFFAGACLENTENATGAVTGCVFSPACDATKQYCKIITGQ